MYGVKYIKGTILGSQSEDEHLVLTMRSENPGNEYIQCLSVKRVFTKTPEIHDDFKYDAKLKTMSFYNESDKYSYIIELNKFQYINIVKSNLVPIFFLTEDILNRIIMAFCAIYYGLDNDLLILAANTKAMISTTSIDFTKTEDVQEEKSIDNAYDIEDELLEYSIFEDACIAVQALYEDGWNYKEFSEEDAEIFSLVFKYQPVNETRNELYKRLGVSQKEMNNARLFLRKKYPNIEFKRDTK